MSTSAALSPVPAADSRAIELDELGDQITSLAGRLAAASCRWLLLIARFDELNGSARFGLASTAAWLSHFCGLSRRTAVEHVRVARALAAHPRLVEEMSVGRMSYSHVRAISRLVRDGEHDLADDLIMVAEHGSVSQLESVVRGLRFADRADSADHSGRVPPEQASIRWDELGQWRASVRLNAERGALLEGALAKVAATRDLNRADALVHLAELALTALTDTEPMNTEPKPPRALRGGERAAIVVHIDASRVRPAREPRSAEREQTEHHPGLPGDRLPYGRIADGPGLPDSVVERLACAGRVRTVVSTSDGTGHRTVLDVGRSHRLVTDRQYRALLLRHDGTCRYPGCANTRYLEAHHIEHWLHGGRTDLGNLALLCPTHHDAHHEGEFSIERLPRGQLRFRLADGRLLPEHPDPSRLITDHTPVEDAHRHVAPTAATTRWNGDRLDHHYAVACLATSRERRTA